MTTKYQSIVQEWKNCQKCELCQNRKRVVQYRGSIPASILFVGEAPGQSEDTLGQPFIGPAGKLLDSIIKNALQEIESKFGEVSVKFGFCDLVGCFPNDGRTPALPSSSEIKSCRARVDSLIKVAKPTAIVTVGKLAESESKKGAWKENYKLEEVLPIVSMYAILKADEYQRLPAIEKVQVSLTTLFLTTIIPF